MELWGAPTFKRRLKEKDPIQAHSQQWPGTNKRNQISSASSATERSSKWDTAHQESQLEGK